jgi:hypothetical protein
VGRGRGYQTSHNHITVTDLHRSNLSFTPKKKKKILSCVSGKWEEEGDIKQLTTSKLSSTYTDLICHLQKKKKKQKKTKQNLVLSVRVREVGRGRGYQTVHNHITVTDLHRYDLSFTKEQKTKSCPTRLGRGRGYQTAHNHISVTDLQRSDLSFTKKKNKILSYALGKWEGEGDIKQPTAT